MRLSLSLVLAAFIAASPVAAADMCLTETEQAAVAERLNLGYSGILQRFDCADPLAPGEEIACAADSDLLVAGQLAAEAYVYAYENATGTETDPANPPADGFADEALAACTDAACACGIFRQQINDALGGTSPLAQ